MKFINLSGGYKKFINENLNSIIISCFTALLIITYIVSLSYVASASMMPELSKDDYILVNKFIYHFRDIKRGDIVLFKPPSNPEGHEYIKRVIGLPGEIIEIKESKVFINNKELTEKYIPEDQKPEYTYGPVKIPEENLFVMGDNRNNSADSHVWGFLPKKNISGNAWIMLWPPGKMKIF
jgi:signal peptidase I